LKKTEIVLATVLQQIVQLDDIVVLKKEIAALQTQTTNATFITDVDVANSYIQKELQQIAETITIERTKYYIKRLIKGVSIHKEGKINDLNLNLWKQYDDLLTDSLWQLEKRDNKGVHHAGYWGNFVPQIPNQFMRRYTKQNDWVLDTFLGSGTTLIECKNLGRNGVGVELQKNIAAETEQLLQKVDNPYNIKTVVHNNDCLQTDYENLLQQNGIKKVQCIFMHPPYWDIIKFSDDKNDLSNAQNLEAFLQMMGNLVDKTYNILEKNRYCVLVISDKYEKGEWIPLAFYTMQEFLKRGYQLKSTIVKNFDVTKGKQQQQELWRYRALVGGFHVFKHEYIFLFKKVK
jgi:DNA modification methylase